MNTKIRFALAALAALASASIVSTANAQGTAFSYQGRLTDNGAPPNGNYDLRFTIYDALTAGNQVGTPLTNRPVALSNGLFTVALDFGAGVFSGPNRWLEIGVRTNGSVGAYATLAPRQTITPSPYAIHAADAGTLGGQTPTSYVAKSGDTMTGSLTLPGATLTGAGALGTTVQEKLQYSGHTLALGVNATAAEVQSQGAVPLYLNHGGNNIIIADSAPGSVGIGTASPSRLLSLYSADANNSPGVNIGAGSTGGRNYSILSTAQNSGLAAC